MKSFKGVRKELVAILGNRVEFNVPLKSYTSFGIGGRTEAMVFPESENEVIELLNLCSKDRVPYLPLGEGTNILAGDRGFNGVVINLARSFNNTKIINDGTESKVYAEGGASLSKLIRNLANKCLGGLEWAYGIPGTIGGAIRGNAGAFGGTVSDKLLMMRVINGKGRIRDINKDDIDFGYRYCSLPDRWIIIGAWFVLKKEDRKKLAHKVKSYSSKRRRVQPRKSLLGGSVFKNPEGKFAGELIERAGFKGAEMGDAYVSRRHANFIINRGDAKASDVCKLIENIRHEVMKKFRINLELELKLVGEGF